MEQLSLSTLFNKEPDSWGLRGDPFLWKEMKLKIDSFERPNTEQDFEKILVELFLNLTGQKIEENKRIFVERFSHGGMSSGFVDSDFWTQKAFKILTDRFTKMKNE